jgi:hypothetical protein
MGQWDTAALEYLNKEHPPPMMNVETIEELTPQTLAGDMAEDKEKDNSY